MIESFWVYIAVPARRDMAVARFDTRVQAEKFVAHLELNWSIWANNRCVNRRALLEEAK